MREFFRRLLAAMHVAEDTPGVDVALPAVPAGLSRRSFLGFLTAGTVGVATLDLDRLLWTPGAKTIFLPPPVEIVEGFEGNSLADFNWLAKEVLRTLKNNLAFANSVNRNYDRHFVDSANRIGDTVQIRLPSRFEPRAAAEAFPVLNTKAVRLDQQHALDVDPDELAACRTRKDLTKRIVTPTAAAMATAMERGRINVMGKLQIPPGVERGTVVSHEASGLCLRGVSFYDVHEGRTRVRFDILGGTA